MGVNQNFVFRSYTAPDIVMLIWILPYKQTYTVQIRFGKKDITYATYIATISIK